MMASIMAGFVLMINSFGGYGGTAWTQVGTYTTENSCHVAGANAVSNMRGSTADRISINWTCVPTKWEVE